MAKRVSMKHKRQEAPVWLFPWSGLRASPFPQILAILIVAGAFAVFLTSVRIRVTAPAPWAASKASVIRVLDDAEGRSLMLRAQEGGPFPSRFEPTTWELASAIEQVAYQAARWRPPAYQPTLRELPDEPSFPQLAKPGEPVLPKREAPALPVPMAGKQVLVPALNPLSGISPAEMPQTLPSFDGKVTPAMAAESWRFLVCVDAAGRVLDFVSLTGGDEPGKAALGAWLRQVTFQPGATGASRWLAVGLSFTNQPADGTDAR
jgi:hypothetical protein